MSQRSLGIAQILIAGLCFGFLGLYGKVAFEKWILPGELLAIRFLLSSLLIGFALKFTRTPLFNIGIRAIFICLGLGIFGYAVFSSLFFMALQGVSASLTVLLLYVYPVLVTIGSLIFLKEKINYKTFVALITSSLGLILLVWGDWKVESTKYIFFGLGSALFYAIYILVSTKYISNITPLVSSFFVQTGAAVVLSLLFFQNMNRPYELLTNHFEFLFSMSLVCSVIPLTLFLAGLQKVKPTEASILSTTEPLFGVIIALLFLNESLSLLQIFGGALVLSSSILLAFRK